MAAVAAAGVNYFVVNGISANRFQRLGLETTRAAIGYEPLGNAWIFTDAADAGTGVGVAPSLRHKRR